MNFKFLGLSSAISLGVVSVIGTSIGGIYLSSNRTIEEIFKNDYLDDTSDNKEEWKYLYDSLQEENEEKLAAEGIDTDETQLKEWCRKTKEKQVNAFFAPTNSTDLIKTFGEYCVLKIQNKIDAERHNIDYSLSFKKLQKAIVEDSKLQKIKKLDETSGEQELMNWCESLYRKGYKNSNSESWQLVYEHCILKDHEFK